MKNIILAMLFSSSVLAGQAQTEAPQVNGPQVSFNTELYDYGTIPQGGDGRCEFIMTNTGNEPLIIMNFQSSCGCLVPSFEREPVMPGKTSILKARYDTNRPGPFRKTLTLTTNAVDRPVVVLGIKGIVQPKASEAPPPSIVKP